MTLVEEKIDTRARDAIYQYMLDHSQIQDNGYYGIQLYFLNQADFWRRIQARHDGFKRYDIEKKQRCADKQRMNWATFNYFKRMAKRNNEVAGRIKNSGTLKEKIFLWIYRKTRNELFR